MGVIKIEGKEISLDDGIIDAGIPAIKAALSVDFPDVENADIEIVTPTRAGAPRTASVVKRGTGKGMSNVASDSEGHLSGSRTALLQKGGQLARSKDYRRTEEAVVLDSLSAAPEYINPAITLAAEVMHMETMGHREDLDKLLRSSRVEAAIAAGEKEGRAVMNSLAACGHAPPCASKSVPVGF